MFHTYYVLRSCDLFLLLCHSVFTNWMDLARGISLHSTRVDLVGKTKESLVGSSSSEVHSIISVQTHLVAGPRSTTIIRLSLIHI